MCPRSGFWGPGFSKIIVFFLSGRRGKKVLTSEQALAAFSGMVDVTQEDACRIGRFNRTPIRSGVSSELATELLPASTVRLIKLHLEQVRRHHPAPGTMVIFPGVISA